MRLLRLVGPDENGTSLILEALETEDGVDGDRFTLPIDDRLRSATSSPPTTTAEAPQAEGRTVPTPREIQVRVRAGETAQAIADEAGIPLERVMRFAYPVLQERIRVIDEARRARARRGGDGLLVPFGELLDTRLARHGIDPASVRWDAYRREDGGWTVTSQFSAHEQGVLAKFSFALLNRTISALDDIAADLLSDRPVQALLAPPPPVIEPVAEEADADWASDWEGGAPPRLAAVPNPGRAERSRPQETAPAIRPPSRRQKAHTRPVPVSNEDELFDQNAFDQQPWHEPQLPFEVGAAGSRGAAGTATPITGGRDKTRSAREAAAVADQAAPNPDAVPHPQAETFDSATRDSELDLEVLEVAVLELEDDEPFDREPGILEAIFDSANQEPVAGDSAATDPVAVARASADPVAAGPVAGDPVSAHPVSADPVSAEPVDAEPSVAAEPAKTADGSGEPPLKRGRRTGEKPRMPSWDDILLGVRHKTE